MDESEPSAEIFVSMILCREVLYSKENLPTAFTIVNQVGVPLKRIAGSFRLPQEEEPRGANFNLFELTCVAALISIYTETAQTVQIALKLKNPQGKFVNPEQTDTQTLHIESGDRGITFDMRAEINPSIEGLYWFEIHANGKVATRTPFRIMHVEQISPQYSGFEETHTSGGRPDAQGQS